MVLGALGVTCLDVFREHHVGQAQQWVALHKAWDRGYYGKHDEASGPHKWYIQACAFKWRAQL